MTSGAETRPASDPEEQPRTSRAAKALSWSTLNTVVSKTASVVIGVALARILGPAEFGVFAVAMVALLAVLSFNELGVSLAIVRWQGPPARIAPTVTTISLLGSAALTGAVMLAAGPFAAAMGAPQAAGLVQLLALAILINGVVATPAAMLQREMQQGLRMIVDQVNVWLGAVVSIVLALLGVGAMSLVVGRLVGAVVSAVLLLRFSPVPWRLGFDRAVARSLLSFGLPLAGASILVFALSFADQLVVGHQLGPAALGAYVLAFNLAAWPIQLLSQPLRTVAPAVFARLQDRPDEMRSGLVRVSRPLTALALPACVALAVSAQPVVDLLYGDQWQAAVAPLRWLAVLAAVRILVELAYDYLVIAGPSWWLLVLQAGWLLVMVPALFVGVEVGGLAGAAFAPLLVAGLVVVPAYAWLLRLTGLRPTRLAPGLVPPLLGSLAVLAASLAVGLLPVPESIVLASLQHLAVVGAATLAVCSVLLQQQRADLDLLRRGAIG